MDLSAGGGSHEIAIVVGLVASAVIFRGGAPGTGVWCIQFMVPSILNRKVDHNFFISKLKRFTQQKPEKGKIQLKTTNKGNVNRCKK